MGILGKRINQIARRTGGGSRRQRFPFPTSSDEPDLTTLKRWFRRYIDLRDRGLIRTVLDEDFIHRAMRTPPQDTRARARSEVMHALTGQKARYVIDWDSIYVEDEKYLNLDDPFLTYELETEEFISDCRRRPPPGDPG